MNSIIRLLVLGLILGSALALSSCTSEPEIEPENSEPEIELEIEVEADFITVGFEDHSIIQLTKGSPEFKEISDEALRIYQAMYVPAEELVSPEWLKKIKDNSMFMEISFIEPVRVTISRLIDEESRSRFLTNEEGYEIHELSSAVFVFTGDYSGHVLPGPDPTTPTDQQFWGVWSSKRSFSSLE